MPLLLEALLALLLGCVAIVTWQRATRPDAPYRRVSLIGAGLSGAACLLWAGTVLVHLF